MADDGRGITALTHTALRDRPRRLWSVSDFALPGISIPGMVAGGGVFLALLIAGWWLDSILGGATILIGAAIAVAAGLLTYLLWGRTRSDHGGAFNTLLFWADYQFLQPKTIHGSGANTTPDRLRWQVIFWEPTDPGWIARREATYEWLIARAPEGTATKAAARAATPDNTRPHLTGGPIA